MTFRKIKAGKQGEKLALVFLKKYGYKIKELNYKTRYGEIDIIADDQDCISFVEVRSRSTGIFGLPEYSINRKKQNQIIRTALSYIKRKKLEDRDCRFDVVCIEEVNSASPKIRLIKNAFELDTWYGY